ncbi:MAG: histidine phosphatase family protein [Geminicoccaceae bacterium]
MLELMLFRHAKSSWDIAGQNDFERDLAPRGRRSAKTMGRLMAERGWIPDLVLTSSAVRTQRTLALAVACWPTMPDIRSLKSLYLASPAQIRAIVARQSGGSRLMVVGHNPGLERLALQLAEPSALRDEIEVKFPTGALARITFDSDSWSAIETGHLTDFIRPREIAGNG